MSCYDANGNYDPNGTFTEYMCDVNEDALLNCASTSAECGLALRFAPGIYKLAAALACAAPINACINSGCCCDAYIPVEGTCDCCVGP